MSMRRQKFLVPPEVLVPRGATLAALLVVPVFYVLRWIVRGVRHVAANPVPTLKAEHE